MDFATLIAECTAYEYKEMLEENKPKSWLKGVSAFANGMGSSLFFGVDNDRTAQGLGNIQKVSIQPLLGGVGIVITILALGNVSYCRRAYHHEFLN